MSRPVWFLILLAYVSLFVYGLSDNGRGPIFPDLLREFGMSDAKGAFFFSTASAIGLVSSLSAPWWLKRWGNLPSLRIFAVVMSAGLGTIAVSHSFDLLLFGAGLLGLGMGGVGLLVNVIATHAAPGALRRQILSGLHCIYGVSSLLAPIVVTSFYDVGWSWRTVMGAFAVLPLVVVAASYAEQRGVVSNAEQASASEAPVGATSQGRRPWRRGLWFSVLLPLYVVVEVLVATRLVLYARRDLGYDVAEANLLLSTFFFLLFAGRLFFAMVPVRWSHWQMQFGSILTTLLLFVIGLQFHPLGLALTGLTMACYYPVCIARLTDELGEQAGFAMSLVLAGQSIGLLVMHALVGALSDMIGLPRALWVGPLCLALVLALLFLEKNSLSAKKA